MRIIENWTRENLAWAAGYLEGEGYFVSKVNQRPNYDSPSLTIRIGAESTDKDALDKLKLILGLGNVTQRNANRANRFGKKPMFVFQIANKNLTYALAVAIFQFMSIRRKEQLKKLCLSFIYLSTASGIRKEMEEVIKSRSEGGLV